MDDGRASCCQARCCRGGVGARLERWIRGGPLGWALDGDDDALSLDARFAGFEESRDAEKACAQLKRGGFSCFATRG